MLKAAPQRAPICDLQMEPVQRPARLIRQLIGDSNRFTGRCAIASEYAERFNACWPALRHHSSAAWLSPASVKWCATTSGSVSAMTGNWISAGHRQ